ncbi:uncharacterized protein F4822DRAFT_301113 [Hypoxylon trugodes]|uniref:uncharacterized protein n=1 Tax=Hypoxylon trugodes TaxID=326681 RepID=UPI002191F113|nr:uncharacterized protein F4822DRAFT_301113 [Hypoxylon trugodes]KAI1388058.1 hypothetical protein F4822DRAFT_301113 [Hypoxylon trugodes]
MNEALCSILCAQDEWYYDSEGRYIKFNNDGTGEVCRFSPILYIYIWESVNNNYKLWCRCNFNYWIAAVLEWKRIDSPRDPTEVAGVAQNRGPQLLGQLNLEIALVKRLPKWVEASILSKSTLINEFSLMDVAFQPKTYTVRIEKGNFIEPCSINCGNWNGWRYELRLLFDKSPYPPRCQWKQPEGGPDGGQFWDHREFVGRHLEDLPTGGRAMNDISPWNGCIVS